MLGGVVDGITPLDGDIDSVVQDSMLILSSKVSPLITVYQHAFMRGINAVHCCYSPVGYFPIIFNL